MGRTKGAVDRAPRKPRADAGKPRKASAATTKAKAQAAADMSNGVNAEAAKRVMKRLQDGHEARLSIMGRAMNECAKEHEIDKRAIGVAKDEGVPIRALKAEFKLWLLDRKKEDIRAALEPDDTALQAQLHAALGGFADSPLGQAAIADAENATEKRGRAAIGSIIGMTPAEEGDEDNADIRPRFNQLSEKERLADQGEDGESDGETLN